MKIAARWAIVFAVLPSCLAVSAGEPRSADSPAVAVSALECGDGGPCCACDGGACASSDAGAAGACDDGNACTADLCTDAGCVHVALADGTSCDDGDACNGLSACEDGRCVPGKPLRCVSVDPCSIGRCEPVVGCVFAAVADGVSCDDGDPCNGAERCRAGRCVRGEAPACNDSNPCTADACDPVRGCTFVPVRDGTSCGRDDACQAAGRCAAGACLEGEVRSCDDANACTVDSCDAASGCTHVASADGTSCTDGNVCNGVELCRAGACRAGTTLSCDDRNPCTTDRCDPVRGCSHERLPDGTRCAAASACITGKCVALDASGSSPVGQPGTGCAAGGGELLLACFAVAAWLLGRRRR